MNYSSVVFVGVLVFSLGWFYCPRIGGKIWFEGPKANLEGFRGEGDEEISSRDDDQKKKEVGNIAQTVTVVDYQVP